jgi:hypothetical protein
MGIWVYGYMGIMGICVYGYYGYMGIMGIWVYAMWYTWIFRLPRQELWALGVYRW